MNSTNLTGITVAATKQPQAKKRSNGKDVYAPEIMPLFNREGWFYRTATAGFFATTEPNSADVYVLAPKPFVVEIKTAHDGVLSLGGNGGWRQGQIEWAEKFEALTGWQYFLAVVFETPNTPFTTMLRKSSGKGKLPRAAFLIPYKSVMETKKLLPNESIVYKARPHMSVEVQENNLDAVTLWKDFSLDWQGKWVVPETHLFYSEFIKEIV